MAVQPIYDSELDSIVFAAENYEGCSGYAQHISIPRAEVLQFLLEKSCEFGDDFSVFDGRAPGDKEAEPTQMTFLSPPDRDCIPEGDE